MFKRLIKKKYSADYYKMMRKNRAALNKINKEAAPWEYGHGIEYLVQFLRWMSDYYKLNENVWGMEAKDEDPKRYGNVPTRLETLEKTLYYYDMWQSAEERYITVVDHPETYKTHDNGDGTVTIEDLGCHCEYKCGTTKETYRQMFKEQKYYKRKFFNMINKYLESWWD